MLEKIQCMTYSQNAMVIWPGFPVDKIIVVQEGQITSFRQSAQNKKDGLKTDVKVYEAGDVIAFEHIRNRDQFYPNDFHL